MSTEKIVIATAHSWNIDNARLLRRRYGKGKVTLVTSPEGLTGAMLSRVRPRYIFFPHWSWLIPESIWSRYECVVFHMTDLPFGRGGTPLQNLISRGIHKTKVSALRAGADWDAGPVYLKHPLALKGNAQEIYERLSRIIFKKMIPRILSENPTPAPQRGHVTLFGRRKPAESHLPINGSLSGLYDFIRMLDAEGYPKAFLRRGNWIIRFSDAKLGKKEITARVRIERSA